MSIETGDLIARQTRRNKGEERAASGTEGFLVFFWFRVSECDRFGGSKTDENNSARRRTLKRLPGDESEKPRAKSNDLARCR